jgi:segregation and condensation protein A
VGEEAEPALRASVFDLISALKRVLDQAPEPVSLHPVRRYDFSVEEQTQYLLARLANGARPSFVSLVEHRPRGFVIATFLAVLEMAQRRALHILPGTTPDDFRLSAGEPDAHPQPEAPAGPDREQDAPRPRPAGDRPRPPARHRPRNRWLSTPSTRPCWSA